MCIGAASSLERLANKPGPGERVPGDHGGNHTTD